MSRQRSNPHETLRYAVLGGGAAGLALAWRLALAGQAVTLFEREEGPGGLASGFSVGGATLERFYHHIFRSDRAIIGLIGEVGLADRLVWGTPETAVLSGGRTYRLDSPLSLLRFEPLSLPERLRMGAAVALLKAQPGAGRLEGQTAATWIRRWMGERAYQTVWRPLLEGKFGAAAERIAAPWFWARIHDRSTSLGYLSGGFQQLYDRLAEEIEGAGGRLRFGTEVTALVPATNGMTVVTAGECGRFDRVISCLPVRVTCRLTEALPAWYRDRFEWGEAYGAHCLILALDRPLTDVYWLNISDPGYPFMVLVEHTNFLPAADYGGRRIVYLGNYRPPGDAIFAKDTETLIAEYLPYLRRIAPGFSRAWIRESWVTRAPFAQPVVTVDYRRHIPPFRTPVPDLFLASMFQVYPHDRGQNYSIALAERLARLLLGTVQAADSVLAAELSTTVAPATGA